MILILIMMILFILMLMTLPIIICWCWGRFSLVLDQNQDKQDKDKVTSRLQMESMYTILKAQNIAKSLQSEMTYFTALNMECFDSFGLTLLTNSACNLFRC